MKRTIARDESISTPVAGAFLNPAARCVLKLSRATAGSSASEMEQATTRVGRLDHPSVHADAIGASAKKAQPASRTLGRSLRLGRRVWCCRLQHGADAVTLGPLALPVATDGTSMRTASLRGGIRSGGLTDAVASSSARLMAATLGILTLQLAALDARFDSAEFKARNGAALPSRSVSSS
jgi:hypothetical protein